MYMHSALNSHQQQTNQMQWQGSKPQKFKGGRKHNNHPLDQLDNLLISTKSDTQKLLGPNKRRFDTKITIGHDQPPKPTIKPNINRTNSTIVFNCQNIPKLIKIPQKIDDNNNNSILFRNQDLGYSKLKKLENGELKTGVYRNFYMGYGHGKANTVDVL